jgi:hypothetical protein
MRNSLEEQRSHSQRGGSLKLYCRPCLNVLVLARSIETMMLVYHARQCLNNIV